MKFKSSDLEQIGNLRTTLNSSVTTAKRSLQNFQLVRAKEKTQMELKNTLTRN